MQLSPQTIRRLSEGKQLITPFRESYKHKATGLSGGLTCAGYDVHLASLAAPTRRLSGEVDSLFERGFLEMAMGDEFIIPPQTGILGVTVERFKIPQNVCMMYFNKSTLARIFLNASATLAEPGWEGHLTLEIFNQTDKHLGLFQGQPIGQVIFNQLDEATDNPYQGKYQNQCKEPVAGIFE